MLAVDIGNTSLRIASFQGEKIAACRSFLSRAVAVPELIDAFRELAPAADFAGVWVSSVYPAANAVVDSAAERADLSRRFIRPGVDAIIPHRLKTPETTGADRLLSALAAGVRHFETSESGYVVVQCGSASTIDVVDGEGVYLGGYIIPGPGLWLSGLAGAAGLPDLSAETPDWTAVGLGDNTRDAMLHGLAVGLPSAVAAIAMFLDDDGLGGATRPIAVTGGWGDTVAPLLGSGALYDRDLVLHGIRIFAERAGL